MLEHGCHPECYADLYGDVVCVHDGEMFPVASPKTVMFPSVALDEAEHLDVLSLVCPSLGDAPQRSPSPQVVPTNGGPLPPPPLAARKLT